MIRMRANMPDLDTSLHMDMLNRFKKKRYNLPLRLFRAIKKEIFSKDIYGLKWGDPDYVAPLKFIRDRYILPYVNAKHNAIEIGPGGGRWTRYLLGFGKLHVVDYHPELLKELKNNFKEKNILFIKNNGTDFPRIEKGTVDYLFSFGTFVHLDKHLIGAYLKNMKSKIKPGANIVIQYSDKTKIMAQLNDGFSDNTPAKMRQIVLSAGYRILEEDLTTLWHSSIIRFTL
jgi:phospholipid N-methyltransferase